MIFVLYMYYKFYKDLYFFFNIADFFKYKIFLLF